MRRGRCILAACNGGLLLYAQLFAALGAVPCLAYLVATLGNTRAEHQATVAFMVVTSTTLLVGVLVDLLAWRRERADLR